jgi:hypothetical protein
LHEERRIAIFWLKKPGPAVPLEQLLIDEVMKRRIAASLFITAMSFLISPPSGSAQQPPPQGHTPVVSDLKGVSTTSSPAALTTLTFFYGKRLTFGRVGMPQRWANILGNVHNPSGISSLTYSLNGGPSKALSMGPDTRRLFDKGDFNIDLSWVQLLPLPDSNVVSVAATDTHANIKNDTVIVLYQPNTQWPIPTTVVWSSSAYITSTAQVVDGQWVLDGGGARNVDLGYDRLIAIGDTTWTDYEVTVPITIHSINSAGYNPTSGRPVVGVLMRWTGHTDDPVSGWQPKSGWNPSGALGMYAFNASSSGGERLEIWQTVVDESGKKISLGQTTLFKMHVESQVDGDFYALRVWPQGQPEPSVWDLTYLDQSRRASRGSALLLSHYVDATFGDVEIDPAIPLPVQVAQFAGVVLNENQVQLSWRTLGETNNYGFGVERAWREPRMFELIPGGFLAGHGTTIQPHEYTFTDSRAKPGVWYYRLKQIDLDGSIAYNDPIRISIESVTPVSDAPVPSVYALEQNFPNPFNPTTSIRFALPVSSHVRLTVHDMLGREVATLMNKAVPAGRHEVTMDGSGLASGMYMYRLQAGEYVATRRLVVMK